MHKLISATIATSILLILTGCTPNNQTVQQRQACNTGDQHPWCMQMAQTKPLGAAPYGLESKGPTNPEMRDDNTPYPRNPALSYTGIGPTTFSGSSGFSGLGSLGGLGGGFH
jgi:hypothetical protein